ncbi:hypothetical protein PV797_00745 [Clostridiaceae bacterium M8S5]|nr:hypothetical protein PV797_00745 [Clostridiaceae bacterium M8S5]
MNIELNELFENDLTLDGEGLTSDEMEQVQELFNAVLNVVRVQRKLRK